MSKNSNRLSDLTVTIYPGYAIVQGAYPVRLSEGPNKFQVEGLPTNYEPNSLYFDTFIGEGEITLGAASYRAANLSTASLLQKSINKRITVVYGGATEAEQKEATGTLVAVHGNTVLLRVAGKVREVRNVVGYIFGGIPEGLSNTPSLVVAVDASQAGDYTARLLYKALNLYWSADYKWIYDEKNGVITIDGSVLVSNASGATFPDASIKVVAGDAGNDGMQYEAAAMAMPMSAGLESAGGGRRSRGVRQAVAESLGQVKVFSIPGRSTVEEGESQKIPFLVAPEVPVAREYRVPAIYGWHAHRGTRQECQVNTVLIVQNNDENKLGKPLPNGAISVMQRDESGALLKTGGTHLGDTAVGEEIRATIGSDFDLKATRVLLDVHRAEQLEDVPGQEEPAVDPTLENDVDESPSFGPAVTSAMPRMSAHVATAQPKPEKKKRLRVTTTKKCGVELFNAKPFEVEFVLEENTQGDNLRFDGEHGFTQTEADRFEHRVKLAPGEKATVKYTLVQTTFEQVK